MDKQTMFGLIKTLQLLEKPKPKAKESKIEKIEKDVLAIIWGNYKTNNKIINIAELQDELVNYFANIMEE